MRVTASLPYKLALIDINESIHVELHLEWPRLIVETNLKNSWNFYECRGLKVYRNKRLEKLILEPINLTLLFSKLEHNRSYYCRELWEFVFGARDELACSGGLVLRKGRSSSYIGPSIETRVDVFGPRLRVTRNTLHRTNQPIPC